MQQIRSRKTFLADVLMSDPSYILQHVQEKAIITLREYNILTSTQKSSEQTVIDLLDKVTNKGDVICLRFLTLLQQPVIQETFPRLRELYFTPAPDTPVQERQGIAEVGEYKMNSLPRGICVIFNNVTFVPGKLRSREGSNKDAAELQDVFRWLGFTVQTFLDQTVEQMRREMQRIQQEQHADCFVCCVLSHGTKQAVFGHDGETLLISELLSPFNGVNCPALVNKPKLFFIQACQGKDWQRGVEVSFRCQGAATGPEMDACADDSYTIPMDSDFLVGMATVQDYVSFRDTASGSWYIQSLCKMLRHCCPKGEDILTILIRVNNEVSKQGFNCKQMPDPRFTLRNRLVLRVPIQQNSSA